MRDSCVLIDSLGPKWPLTLQTRAGQHLNPRQAYPDIVCVIIVTGIETFCTDGRSGNQVE